MKFGAKQLAILLLALVFLFETWVWGSMVAAAGVVAAVIPWTRFQTWARSVIEGLPAIVAVLLFAVPLFVSEFGAFISVVMMATGHLLVGIATYIALKIVGVMLIPVIFDITRQKLMTLLWFAFLYGQFQRLHAAATYFVALYRIAALDLLRRSRETARTAWARFWAKTEDAGWRGHYTPEPKADSFRSGSISRVGEEVCAVSGVELDEDCQIVERQETSGLTCV